MNLDEATRKTFNSAIAAYNRDRYKNNPKYRDYMIEKSKRRYASIKAKKEEELKSQQQVEEK